MRADDLAAVSIIAAQVHPGYFERNEVFAERLSLFPGGCHVFANDTDIAGYVFSHPWRALTPPWLDSLLGSLPATPSTYYIHDIALLPEARGQGAAQAMIKTIKARARGLGLTTLSLVTIEAAGDFWQALGFACTPVPDAQDALQSYSAGALFMTRGTD
jgi:GNAT superfamily N-acetyltransferase